MPSPQEKADVVASVVKAIRNPGSAYRGKPFWAWNGALEPEELRRQIRVMHSMGLGGFFMHARVGLDTAYLSPAWFDCVKACIDEAAKLDMEAWLYDEDRWPSGAAGGLVTRNPKYRMRSLVLRELKVPTELTWDKDTVAAFTAQLNGVKATNVRRIAQGTRPATLAAGESILLFAVRLQDCIRWFNGYTYLDTLSHEAVRQFIRVTHEAYRKQIGKTFGKRVPGIFTDEPGQGCKLQGDGGFPGCKGTVPWTVKLPATFRKRYGYDLIPHLPEICFDVDGQAVTQARYHYHDCVTHLFVDAFSRQIGEWCGKNGLQFTGHVLEEDHLSSQTNQVGSCMRHYEHMQAPGMDLLTEHWRIYDTAKQVTSAAHQFGRKWRLTETYGCTGWDFPFAGHKALGDWQVALGINLRCQHLAWYTMRGEAKRDYPAAIFDQSPWWELYPKVEDYFARVLAVMTRGQEVRDLLVIHPIESMWTLCKLGWQQSTETHEFDRTLSDISNSLLAANVDFDYGDEELLSRHGKIGKSAGTARFNVAKAGYKAVLVPPMKTMRRSTLELLRRFRAAGGTVVFAGEIATYLDALPSRAVAEFAASCPQVPAKGPAVPGAVEATCRRVSITDEMGTEIGPALHLLREDKDAFYLFVCNTGEDFAKAPSHLMDQPLVRDRQLSFPAVRIRGFAAGAGAPVMLDPETGEGFRADAKWTQAGWEVHTTLPALASRLLIFPKRKLPLALPSRPALNTVRQEALSGEPWDIVLSECSNLVLDRPRYKIGDQPWHDADEILRVDRAVRDALGVQHRGGDMVQPWAREKKVHPKHIPVTLAYSFEAEALPSGDLFLAVERPETFRVTVNGLPLNADAETGWWTDRSLRKLPVDPAVLRLGRNEIVLESDFREDHSGLEIMYLLGSFGSRVKGTEVVMTAAPGTLKLGDWTEQGLAFYSGSVTYLRKVAPELKAGERLFLHVPDYRGVAVRVLVDGKVAGITAWQPNEIEITECVGKGTVELGIQLVGHRRNSHGPHHLSVKWPPWTGPGEFVAGGDRWFDGYQLVPCGLMQPPVLVTRKG